MKKKVLAMLLVAAMAVASLAGCGNKDTGSDGSTAAAGGNTATTDTTLAGTYDIVVWVPEKAVDLTTQQIANFNTSNEYGITINATVTAVSEADAATSMLQDVEAGADLFFFAQDQTARLINSGALAKLGTAAAATVTSNNDAGAVAACAAGDELYAYPLTADNGYFMYYDKSVIPEEDLDSFEKLLADCENAGRTFTMEAHTSAWYVASWFFATGCVSEWETDDEGNFVSLHDTFNSDAGLAAAKALYSFVTSTAYNSASSVSAFQDAIPAAIVVSGTWDYADAVTILGDNLGCAPLPSFTVDGQSYHMGSYRGYKLLGVKPQSDAVKQAVMHQLAQYLTSAEAQLERFNTLAWGPANLEDQQNEAVLANIALTALREQDPYAIAQGQIHGSWWDIGKLIASGMIDEENPCDGSDESLKAILQNYEDTCAALFNMTTDEKLAWSVIGAFDGTNWDTDYPMTRTSEVGDPTYYSEAIYFNAGDELKVRQGKSWDVNFGGDGALGGANLVVEEPGYYYVKLVTDEAVSSASLTLEKSSFYGWTVIGSIAGDGWSIDIPMSIQEDGTTFKTDAIELKAGEEFKVRYAKSWDLNYGADGAKDGANVVVEADGTYQIVFDSLTGLITIE